jgi:hypothetical protein
VRVQRCADAQDHTVALIAKSEIPVVYVLLILRGFSGALSYNYVPAIRPEFRISNSGFQGRAVCDDSHFKTVRIQPCDRKLRRVESVDVDAIVHFGFTISQLFVI